jgi:VIT1/CCC1 family predicted Fe2+/Mn2+ transporter
MSFHRTELHFSHRNQWLRAAVLGANDGIVSTASLVLGVAAADPAPGQVLLAGVAALVAGALSMAAGEYVSVSSQADTEQADLTRERQELADNHEFELNELTHIYINRGLDEALAREVAIQLTAHDALGAHARDELGLSELHTARPLQAALASALTFAIGAALPLALVVLAPAAHFDIVVAGGSLLTLALLGALAAKAGGAALWKGTARVTLWGAVAMAATMGIGSWFGTTIG